MKHRLLERSRRWVQHQVNDFYGAFMKPRQHDIATRNREIVLNVLLSGTFVAFLLLALQLIVGWVYLGQIISTMSIMVALGACLLVAVAYFIARRQYYVVAASILTLIYTGMAVFLLLHWGNSLPFALILLCLVIVLAGILLGSRFALYAAGLSVLALIGVEFLDTLGVYSPDESWLARSASFGEVVGYSIILLVLGVISWLFGRQTERSLMRAQQAEAALLKEQAQLEIKIKERTLELQVLQFEEIQQLYRFAEVGQLTTALLHELANHLAILTLDLEDIQQRQRSRSLKRARQSILYLDNMVERVREQLQDSTAVEPFNIATRLHEVVRLLNSRATEIGVKLDWSPPRHKRAFHYNGDAVKFNQIVAVLINNAIEAYDPKSSSKKPVEIHLSVTEKAFKISVKDYGRGIAKNKRQQLFEPFVSTKKKGMGIGLFIARRMLEKYFKGTIRIEPTIKYTQFTIIIPQETNKAKTHTLR